MTQEPAAETVVLEGCPGAPAGPVAGLAAGLGLGP